MQKTIYTMSRKWRWWWRKNAFKMNLMRNHIVYNFITKFDENGKWKTRKTDWEAAKKGELNSRAEDTGRRNREENRKCFPNFCHKIWNDIVSTCEYELTVQYIYKKFCLCLCFRCMHEWQSEFYSSAHFCRLHKHLASNYTYLFVILMSHSRGFFI